MVSVVVPAFNEEKNLRAAVLSVVDSARKAGNVVIEIVIINDGSADRTGEIAEQLTKEMPFVRVIHHPTNSGIGQSFIDGVHAAKYPRVTLFPGDNGNAPATTVTLLRNANRAELVASYIMNTETRGRLRFTLSTFYTFIYAATFNIYLKYVNGTPVYSTDAIRALKVRSRGYSLFAEINVKLLRKGATYLEFPSYLNPDNKNSSALRIKNLVEVVVSYLRLVLEVFVLRRAEYSNLPKRIADTAEEG